MEDERDILILTDEDNNEIKLEVLRFFFYNGEEYAMVTEVQDETCGCGCDDCSDDECGCGGIDVFFMKVEPVDDENEEYSFVDEELSEKLMRVVEADMDEDEEDEEDEEEKE